MESRLVEFLNLLSQHPRGLPVRELARQLGVARQSVYRLRDKALGLGVWVTTHAEDPEVPLGHMRLECPQKGELVFHLTLPELEALRTAVKRIAPLTPLAELALARLMGKNGSAWAKATPLIFTPLVDQFAPGLFPKIARAIRQRRVVQLTYKNAKGEVKTFPFHPYRLIARDPHLYLVGKNPEFASEGEATVRELRLDQVLECKLTTSRFPNPHFDAEAYARLRFRAFAGEGEPQRVRVWFSAEKAGFIRRTQRHPTQVVEDLPDGSVIWEVQVPLSEDLVHFVLGYGPHAKVLEPESLRQKVLDWARGALEANASPKGVTEAG